MVALDGRNRLFAFDSNVPAIVTSRLAINGLARRERLVDIDVRPATGGLIAFSNQGRTYAVDPATGLATLVGQTSIELNRRGVIGIDFNPTVDRLRIVNTRGENLRLNPDDGQIVDADVDLAGVQFDAPLAYASTDVNAARTAAISGIAYTNSERSVVPTTTTLYGIDTATDNLVTIGSPDGTTSPNTGQVFTVGSLGVDARDPVAFDIATTGATNTAYAAFRARGQRLSLYTIDLTTGAATNVGTLGRGVSPVGIVVLPPPVTAPPPDTQPDENPTPDPEPTPNPDPTPDPDPVVDPNPTPNPDPTPDPDPVIDPNPTPDPTPNPVQ
jgi:hypothetical protein